MTQTMPNPLAAADLVLANANAGKPRYNTPGDWIIGVVGDDPGRPVAVSGMPASTATLAVARSGGGANEADYSPRTQAVKPTLNSADGKLCMGSISGSGTVTANGTASDIGRDRGNIGPRDPYPNAGTSAPAAPVVSSISPTTAAAAALPVTVTITGTGFTPFSHVHTGGQGNAARSEVYISPTSMQVTIQAGTVAGTVSIAVEDHSVLSNTDKVFTVT